MYSNESITEIERLIIYAKAQMDGALCESLSLNEFHQVAATRKKEEALGWEEVIDRLLSWKCSLIESSNTSETM